MPTCGEGAKPIVPAVANSFTWQRQIFPIAFRPIGRGFWNFPFSQLPAHWFSNEKKFVASFICWLISQFWLDSRAGRQWKSISGWTELCALWIQFENRLKATSCVRFNIRQRVNGTFSENFTKLVNLKSCAFKSCRIRFSFNQFRQKNGQKLACSRNAINRMNRNWK